MMITIHGLPPKYKYQDVKALIKQECKINDFILDNLVAEPNGSKKVRVGLTDDDEGYRLMKCLDRYRCSGNFVLSVLPVGKPTPQNAPIQSAYDSRGGFQSQPRNDYPPSANYGNHGPTEPHGSIDAPSRPPQWGGNNQNNQWNNSTMSAHMPQNSFGYQNITPVHQNQPFHQQHSSHPVRPEIRSGPQGRGPQEQSFGCPPKSNVAVLAAGRQEGRPHVLRSVELLDTPSNPSVQVQGRYPQNNQPYQAQDKPMTIMKDNFQGPSSYIAASNQQQGNFQSQGQGHGPSQGHAQIQPWAQSQGQHLKQPFSKQNQMPYEKPYHEERKYPPSDNRPVIKSNEPARVAHDSYKKYEKSGSTFSPQRMEPPRRHSPSGRSILPSDGRVSPSGRSIPAHARRVSPSVRVRSATGRRVSPSGRGISPTGKGISAPGRRISPSGRHVSPSDRLIAASGRHVSPTGRRISPSGRRISPSGRRISPSGRRISPSFRRISPSGRRISPSGRRISPTGRRISPSGRRNSPSGRRISPSGRRVSPSDRRTAGRVSPGRRLISPTRREAQRPTIPRYSPSRHQDKSADKYGSESQKLKQVRPAYEQTAQAPNQSMYSGGYRPNIHENVQYPVPGTRQGEQSPWQQERDKAMYSSTMKKLEEERRDVSRTLVRGGGEQGAVSPRPSRSPLRRERSPLRDRFKRHSPSPRSPRRSWALEKRRSPEAHEAPPPPLWPGQNRDDDFTRHARPEFPPRIDKDEKKHVIPPWERPNFDKDDERARRPVAEEIRPYVDERARRNVPDREPVHASQADRFPPQNPKVAEYTREDFERGRGSDFRRQDDADRKAYVEKRDFREPPRPTNREDRHRLEPVPVRRESPLRDFGRKGDFRKEIDRDFEDVYKKALEFKKKTEELRKSGERKREGFSGEERSRTIYEDSKFYMHRREAESARYHDNRDDRPDYRSEVERHIRRPDYSPERSGPTDDHQEQENAHKHKRYLIPPLIKATRDKAVEDISNKILDKHLDSNFTAEQKLRIREELRFALSLILFEMFGELDLSFIEIVIKYQAKYNDRDEQKILRDVMSSMPSLYRNSLKRPATESSQIPPKSSRWSPAADMKKDGARVAVYSANPKLRKDYEDFKKDVMNLKPKPQRPKQRVISEMNPENRLRSPRDNYKLRQKVKFEAKANSRIRPEHKMRPLSEQKREPDTRPKQITTPENKTEYKIKPEDYPVHKAKPEAKAERKLAPEVKLKIKTEPEDKPEIKEKPVAIKAEHIVRPENKLKPEILRSEQKVKEVRPEQKGKPEIRSEQRVKSEMSKLAQKPNVEENTVALLETIDEGATPIEDIIEEELPVAKPSEGHYELNPLMTRMVEAELQDIMIKVWQELPDNSQNAAEKLVADKLRNAAGDDIRNVLGLNVTKRLLNVYNPLFVKIQFSDKPDRVNLATFLRKYNFIAFKRIGKADVFAAQMKTIKDFDRICIAKDIMCGDVKVTVNPCYRFTKCPANLKTAFDDKCLDDETAQPNEDKQITAPESNSDTTMPSSAKSEVVVVKTKQTNMNVATNNADSAKSESVSVAEVKTTKSNENVTETKICPIKSETNTTKHSLAKPEENAAKPSPANSKTNLDKTESNTEIKITQPPLTIDTQSKPDKVENKVTNSNESKVTEINKELSEKTNSIDENKNDNDELDDNDMFSLMSGGIVLDECTESDEE